MATVRGDGVRRVFRVLVCLGVGVFWSTSVPEALRVDGRYLVPAQQNRKPQAAGPQQSTGPAVPLAVASPRAVLDEYCVTCHNSRLQTGGLALDVLDPADVGTNAETWEKVIRKVKVGVMPPQGMPQPDEATRLSLVDGLERSLDRLAAAAPFPGQPSIHRLNRSEYANAIRDLLALDIDATALLPPDELVYGFDNIGEALALSSSLLERYSSAASQIATLAVGDAADVVPGSTVYRTASDLSQDTRNEGLPLGTEGGLLARSILPLDGEYLLKVTLFKTNLGLMRGLEFPRELQILVDGEVVLSLTVGGKESFEEMLQNQTRHAEELEGQMQVRVPLKAGVRAIGATFVQRAQVLNTRRLQAFDRTTTDTSETLIGPPHIETLTVVGPFDPLGRVKRPAAVGSSSVSRRRCPRKNRVQGESSPGWHIGRTAVRTPRRMWRNCFASTRKAGAMAGSTEGSAWRWSGCSAVRSSSSGWKPVRIVPKGPSTTSATSSLRPGCRSSSGAAYRTTNC